MNQYPDPMFLSEPPHTRVAAVTLGLTLYLDRSQVWAREGAGAILRAFLGLVPLDTRLRFTTSKIQHWIPIGRDPRDILKSLSQGQTARVRHQFELRVADQTGAPDVGFRYREVDDRRLDRTGFIQIHLPATSDPEDLLSLAGYAGAEYPIHCGVGGYQVSWSPRHRSTAYWWAYRWCRRFLALDVQDPDRMGWNANRLLPGASWLTLLSSPFAKRRSIDVVAAQRRRWESGVSVGSLGRSLIVQAGSEPELGDLNQLVYPKALAEASRWLAPHFVQTPQEHLGGFYGEKLTVPWLRRFVDPEGWK